MGFYFTATKIKNMCYDFRVSRLAFVRQKEEDIRMKKILTMILLVLVVAIVGCGSEETQQPAPPAETPQQDNAAENYENPIPEPMGGQETEPEIFIAVEEFALSLREATGIISVSRPLSREIAHTSRWEHEGREIYHHNKRESLSMRTNPLDISERGGYSLMGERIITVDEELIIFRAMGDDVIFFRIYLGDWMSVGTHTAYFSITQFLHAMDGGGIRVDTISNVVAFEFMYDPDALAIACDYVEIGGRLISPFELRIREEGLPFPEAEQTPNYEDTAFFLEAPIIIFYAQGMEWEYIPYSFDSEEVTAQQFEAEMGLLYESAQFRLVSYRSIRSRDSFVSYASGAHDIFMPHSEAIARLGNETAQWAHYYRAILEGIPTRPIDGFGLGDFVEYGVDSVSILDITGNNIPDLIFTTVASGYAMQVSFFVYSFDGSGARRIIHIDNLEAAGVSSPYYHAYLTSDGTLIVNNNNTGFGRIHIFRN